MLIKNQEALNERANNLETRGLNGFKMVLVTLHPDPHHPVEAHLEVHFHNNHEIANILDYSSDPKLIFPISGGHRVLAGPGVDQVQVIDISGNPADTFLTLTVVPIGDYSTYTLSIDYQNVDPVFSEIPFKFRPGCFNLCEPDWEPAPEPKDDPIIDYLAKDYDSFRHTLIAAMMERVPGWQPTSEADLDQVLLESFSVAADELSDYQDRVTNEAYLGTARKRVSLARHARLMDYHIHQGNQASTWLALKAGYADEITQDFMVWAGGDFENPSSPVFMSRRRKEDQPLEIEPLSVYPLLNEISLYTWEDTIPALAAGSTSADLKLSATDQESAETVQDLIRNGKMKYLLIQEHKNPLTGEKRGLDPNKRQVLKLLSGSENEEKAPTVVQDSAIGGIYLVRVHWEEKDRLRSDYCFTIDCPAPKGKVEDVSLFHGNLVQVYYGLPVSTVFKEPGELLDETNQHYYERTEHWGTICRLPAGPLAYKDTPPGGEIPPESTLNVRVTLPGGDHELWEEVISLIHSDGQANHFIVEADESGRCLIRFGNGINGKELPEQAVVQCMYQIGSGLDGNIGADTLIHFEPSEFPNVEACWNPFDVTDGRAPEPVAEIIRRVPEAYRCRQLRAVTLQDYVDRAEELDEVAKAAARYAWTGSWRTVQIAVDPVGTTELKDELRKKIAGHLDAVRLIGEDLEIRPPLFVPLEIHIALCIHPDYWPEDITWILEQELSDGFTPDGRRGFFHPDCWTFGQPLRASQIIGRIQLIKGVDHVLAVSLKRWNEVTPGTPDKTEVRGNEIIQVHNDPDHKEKGYIFFDEVKGGRR